MRSQGPNQEPEPKKSVFDRLGRQIEAGRSSMNRRPSPGQYGEYMPPPPPTHMHDVEFGRYGRGDPMGRGGEVDWRFQNDRRVGHDRHPGQLPPPPPLQQTGPPMYDMDMGGRGPPMPPYFPPHPQIYNQPGPPPPPPGAMGPGGPPIGTMHQRRSSPKYDRHGNPIMRGGPMMMGQRHPGMSPPREYPPMPGPGMIGPPHEMTHSMRHMNMYLPPRWQEGNLEPEFHPDPSRLMPDSRFSPFAPGEPHRFNPQHSRNEQPDHVLFLENEPPKYTKWRERRDVITTLDKETAKSSSRTDSLRSSLQQPENRNTQRGGNKEINKSAKAANSQPTKKEPQAEGKKDTASKEAKKTSKATTDPRDISDGEIIDDEDSSDESDVNNKTLKRDPDARTDVAYMNRSKNLGRYNRSRNFYEPAKKRRMMERDDYAMDYETISDEDLDDFMDDKRISADDAIGEKNVSEIELLNALGLDWAHLVEMAKQSKSSNKEASSGSALSRFSPANYLPTLGITADLAGPEIYELIQTICKA